VKINVAIAALLISSTDVLVGQTTFASITGSVVDSTGAAIAGVEITATHAETGVSAAAASNNTGVFTIAQLREGDYVVRARSAGFKEFLARNVALASREVRRMDIRLEVGTVETSVEVSAGASLIETETARISDTRGANVLKALPHGNRSLWSFLGLSPQVLKAGGTSSTIRFAGSRANQADYSIDGTTIANPNDATQITPLVAHVEAFQEVRVDVANNTAEFSTLGQVTVISKTGTNNLHGSAFNYYTTSAFRARNPFALQRDSGIVHYPGASLGGPVMIPKLHDGRNRTFFFASIEATRGSAIRQLLNPTVPLAAWRAGDFGSTAIRDPLANAPFAGNRIPLARINPVASMIQDQFYPLPNFGSATILTSPNYLEQKVRPYDPSTTSTLRGDHHFSPRTFLFARWSYNRQFGRPFQSNLPTIGQQQQQRDTRAFNVSLTRHLRANFLNEFRYGVSHNNNPIAGPLRGLDQVRNLGLRGLAANLPDIEGMLNVNFAGIGITGLTQRDWTRVWYYTHQFQDHVSWYRGRHTIKAGGQVNRIYSNSLPAVPNLFGNVTFSNRYTNHPYADFLLGAPSTSARGFPSVQVGQRRNGYDFFVADDFKATQRLTVTLGLRYELHPSYREVNGQQAVFDIEQGRIVVPNGSMAKLSTLLPRNYVGVVEAGDARLPGSTLVRTDRNNFAPRIGLAFRPWGNRTVFRTGYGLFYDLVPRSVNAGGTPFTVAEPAYTNPAGTPAIVLPVVFPGSSQGPSAINLPAAVRTDLRNPFSMQYNFTIEHQRWDTGFRISYVGTNTRQGNWVYDINQPVADGRLFVDKPRRFPAYPGVNYVTNGAGHQYHALTTEVERRMSRGLYFQFSWSLARDIGDLERNEAPENAYDRRRERGVWSDIPTHRVTANCVYELPFGKGRPFLNGANRVANAIAGGWEISAIFNYNSGEFLTPLWTGRDPAGYAFTANRTPALVTIRADHLRNANLPASERTTARWFDTGAFGAPQNGAFGTSARGVIKGPDVRLFHSSLAKSFSFGERLRFRLDLTAMNSTNHPNYNNPATNISQTAAVGVITGIGGISALDQVGSRVLRTGMRAEW